MRYFTAKEFEKCNPSCSVTQMDHVFLEKLDTAREIARVPFKLLCGYRSPEHDISRGRSGKGYHTLGRAVDVSCVDGVSRWRIVYSCLRVGLSVGVYSSFIHIDNRSNPIVFYGK